MGLWDKLKGELIDIVQFMDDSNDTIVHRFDRLNNEIKYGAKLVVREGQAAVFINEGKIADVFKPGTYDLKTQNLPILSTLMGWKYGFESPFKAEVYFVSTRRFTDQKWGTKNQVVMEDPQYGPVFLRAFGTYAIRVKDPAKFIREVVGTDSNFTTDEINNQLRNIIVPRFSAVLGKAQIPVLRLLGNYDELSDLVTKRIGPELEEYGIEVLNLMVENISMPPEQEERFKQLGAMKTLGNVNVNMQAYQQFQAANAIPEAAKNPGGLAAAGVGLGMGIGMAGQFNQAMQPMTAAQPAMPPPLPSALAFFAALNGQQAGPFELTVLQQHVASGQLKRETLVWKQGMSAWTPAGQVQELGSLFTQMPPPLPPQ